MIKEKTKNVKEIMTKARDGDPQSGDGCAADTFMNVRAELLPGECWRKNGMS